MHGGRELADGYRKYKRVDLLIMSENNDINEKSFGERLKGLWNYLKKYKNNFQFILICLFIGFVFEKLLVKIYDDTIMRLLSEVNEGWFFACIMFAALTGFAWYLWKKKCETSLDAVPRMILIITLALIYVRYRFTGAYIYYPEGCWIKYLDILFLILSAYAVYQIRLNYKAEPDPGNSPVPHDDSNFISGYPIEDKDDDELGFGNSAQNIANRLDKVPSGVSFSIGINSAWGDGKTSYMNLIRKNINTENYILINFNPVESERMDLIQVDFFKALKKVLLGENGELAVLIDNYMKAIGIVDESNLVSKMRELKETFCHSNELDKLKAALVKINKRLVIIIDDIDRLTPEEALKTIKLVRYTTANISDIIFITIYDRDCINQLTRNRKGDDLSLFWDKFFDMEIQLPYRPPSVIISYMGKQLQKWFDEFEPASFKKAMAELEDKFILFIRNLRDAKRFLNAFYMEYLDVKGEVVFEHFFYVRLLKYRYTDIYYALRAKEYIESDYTGEIDYTRGNYSLRTGFEKNLKYSDDKDKEAIKKVLELLFHEHPELDEIRPIYDCASFETYFLDGISNMLSLDSIKSLLGKSVQDAKLQIDKWVESGCLNELMYYFGRGRKSKFDNQNKLELNVKLAFYLLKYASNPNYYVDLKDYLCFEKVRSFLQQSPVDELQYKDFLRELFSDDSQGKYIYNDFIRQNLEGTLIRTASDELIFSNGDLLEYAKNSLTYYLDNDISKNEENNISTGLQLLYSCVQKNDGTNPPVLDKDACQKMKEYIESNPEDYFSCFVLSENGTIYPELRYESIFGSKDEFDKFLKEEKLNQIQRIKLARNFWKLYESNGYVPIKYSEGVDAQKKIDENFSDEVLILLRIKEIQRKVQGHLGAFRGSSEAKREALNETKELEQEFNGIASKIGLSIKLIQETEKLFARLIKKLKQELNLPV